MGFGVGAIACGGFHFLSGAHFQLLQVEGKGLIVLLAMGVAAVAGGLLRNALLCVIAGGVLLAAAVVQLVQLGGSRLLGGNASTFAVFLGFGIGLVVTGLAALLPPPGAADIDPSTPSTTTAANPNQERS
ncbi:MAG: hypothetical protein DLM58_12540 [Pseudonocardiales bacterium]|nr:MAG: hypothetical protein DLM58_12540 [Pseudonocardiales bacterium]